MAKCPPCDRCKAEITSVRDIMGILVLTAYSPIMATTSPPVTLCPPCGTEFAVFLGVPVPDGPG